MSSLLFRKSSFSHQNQCIEVADGGAVIAVRDSKDADGPALTFTRRAWAAFTEKAAKKARTETAEPVRTGKKGNP